MTDFDALDDALSDVLDHGPLGEVFRLIPRAQAAPNAAMGADPTRSEVEFIGTYFGAPKTLAPNNRARIGGTAITISCPADAFPVRPQTGDLIKRMANAKRFEVRYVRTDTTARLQIEVAL